MEKKNDSSLSKELEQSRIKEKELRIRVEDLSDFIENASLPLHCVNGSGIIIWANQTELDLLGYSKEEYVGTHICNFHADKKVCEDILARLIRKETLINFSATLETKAGKHIPVLINSNVRWDGDKFIHTRCFTRDISNLKFLEQDMVKLMKDLEDKVMTLEKDNSSLKEKLSLNDAQLIEKGLSHSSLA